MTEKFIFFYSLFHVGHIVLLCHQSPAMCAIGEIDALHVFPTDGREQVG